VSSSVSKRTSYVVAGAESGQQLSRPKPWRCRARLSRPAGAAGELSLRKPRPGLRQKWRHNPAPSQPARLPAGSRPDWVRASTWNWPSRRGCLRTSACVWFVADRSDPRLALKPAEPGGLKKCLQLGSNAPGPPCPRLAKQDRAHRGDQTPGCAAPTCCIRLALKHLPEAPHPPASRAGAEQPPCGRIAISRSRSRAGLTSLRPRTR